MKIIKYMGIIRLKTGLHIGGGDDTMKIGGIDNGVIKDANTNKPYIPGSSLKGKMRSLLEWHFGFVGISDGEVFNSEHLKNSKFQNQEDKNKAETFLKLFGDKEGKFQMTRISVGDCFLTQEMVEKEKNKAIKLSEAKYENTINRCDARANPRQTERVPAGVEFDFDIRIKVLDDDHEAAFKEMIEKALTLVQNDYLGGSGSRGYGRVELVNPQWS